MDAPLERENAAADLLAGSPIRRRFLGGVGRLRNLDDPQNVGLPEGVVETLDRPTHPPI